MKKTNVSSPEFFPSNALERLSKVSFYSMYRRFSCRMRRLRYEGNSFNKEFDWDWSSESYNRIALVNLLVKEANDCKYLEIGCASNQLFNSVFAQHKTGVDPASGGNVRKTSDDFFAGNRDSFDVIFIDGLHTYEQVRKDIINSIKVLKPGGYIALHDMLPRSWIEEHTPVVTHGPWLGDVWKVAFELAETDGLEFRVVKIDYGVGVIKLTKPNVQLRNLESSLQQQSFRHYYENIQKLPVVDWDSFVKWKHASSNAST